MSHRAVRCGVVYCAVLCSGARCRAVPLGCYAVPKCAAQIIIRDSETILDIWKDCLAIVFIVEVHSFVHFISSESIFPSVGPCIVRT